MLSVSMGICAYNEEQNIEYLLKSLSGQITDKVHIEEIIIISDGSTDRTDEIVQSYIKEDKIKVIRLKNRCGKYAAVNKFLELAKSPVLVLASADIILAKDAVEKLGVGFLSDGTLGIAGCHPKPVNSIDHFMGYVVNLQWHLHHELSLIRPKFGELIAFRNVIDSLPLTCVDEEQIAAIIKNKGYALKYIPEAVVYNKGPENVRDFLIQRRRIYSGHIILKKICGYEVTTLKGIRILKCLLENVSSEYKKNKLWLLGAVILEMTGRVLGGLDTIFKKDHYKWEIARSSKNIICYATFIKH